jgi:glycosyltransferase involved in cell wall biosynthesis
VKYPKVTVLMAVYNGERHLPAAVDSVLRQGFCDYEFLIVNDGSTDHTRDIILSYDDSRIRLVDNERQLGLTRSLNRGIALAKGEFIARHDADDISEPERVARQWEFLQSNSNIALVGAWYKKIDETGCELGARELPCGWSEIRWALLFFCPLVHSAVMLRRSALVDQVGFYNEAFVYAQDFELWSRIARQSPVANLPEYLLRLRISSTSMTSTYGEIVQNEFRRIATANLAELIGIEKARMLIDEPSFANTTALMFGDYRRLSANEVITAWERISDLLAAFVRRNKNRGDDGRRFDALLRSRVARRFVEIGHRATGDDSHLVKVLLSKACRLYWPLVFARRPRSLGVRLLRQGLLGHKRGDPTAQRKKLADENYLSR